ncbi:MaoC family dehydratase [Oceaniserpentilla sp. 4NH20-0058]|uniref:MaoC family dehydratase n=1 Tax=Oceaniserpentilla sp. 4NH20-0058 TaxID=3127660 RepID=UPI003109D5D5
MKQVSREEIFNEVNSEVLFSDWFEVKQEQINQFADCTIDHQYIHIDPVKAAETPFGTTIAHGFLTLSMLSYLAEEFSTLIDGFYMGMNYGFDKVRFISPVKVGSKIRGAAKLIDVIEKKPGMFQLKTEVTVEIEGSDKPALQAEWITIQFVK